MPKPATTSIIKKQKAAKSGSRSARKSKSSSTKQKYSEELLSKARDISERDIDFINNDEFPDSGSFDRLETILVTEYENKRKPRVKPSSDLPAYFAKLLRDSSADPTRRARLVLGDEFSEVPRKHVEGVAGCLQA